MATESFSSAAIALLVSGENFADAVSSSYLAGVSDGPVLLTRRDQVPASTVAALQTLSIDFVVIVGGTDAISPAVATQLTNAGFVNARVAGANRYETAKNVSFVTGAPTVGVNEAGKRTAILASGQAFPDALAAGPVAYDDAFPLLLTEQGSLHTAAEQALTTLQIGHVLITGGPAAIGTAVEQRLSALGITFERLAGDTRYSTAQAIATKAVAVLGHSDTHVDIATGANFPDALSGGPHAGNRHGVILLSPPGAQSGSPGCAFLADHSATVTSGHILGGEQAIDLAAESGLEACAAGTVTGPGPVDPNIDFVASPATDRIVQLPADDPPLTWTFSGIDVVADIALVPCFAVTPGSATTFADDPIPLDGAFPPDTHDSAVRRTDYLGQSYRSFRISAAGAAQVTGVNGAVAPTSYVDGVAVPANGVLTVTVAAASTDCVVPLVFGDAADDDVLQLDANDRPTDDFSIGGALVFTAGEAPEGTPIAGEVMYADETGDSIVLVNGFRYDYGDAGDTYYYGQFSVQPSEFEIALSSLDSLAVAPAEQSGGAAPTYHRAAPTRFGLGSDSAGRVTGVTATFGDFDDVAGDSAANDARVTFSVPAPIDGLVVDYAVEVFRCAPACLLVGQVLDSDHEPASAPVPPNQDVNGDGIDDDVNRQVIVENQAAGSYRFVAHAITFAGPRSLFGSDPSALTASAAPPGSPRSILATFTEAGATDGKVTPGDILRITFDEAMAPPDAGDVVTVQTPSLTANFVHGPNFTFAVVGEVLSITVVSEVAGNQLTYAGLQVIGSAGVTDVGGLEWDIAGSTDRSFG